MKISSIAAALALSSTLSISTSAIASPTTFVHLFEWKWEDIATECETFLGPEGYAAVQRYKCLRLTNTLRCLNGGHVINR